MLQLNLECFVVYTMLLPLYAIHFYLHHVQIENKGSEKLEKLLQVYDQNPFVA
jgi:hypothetical protein